MPKKSSFLTSDSTKVLLLSTDLSKNEVSEKLAFVTAIFKLIHKSFRKPML